MSLFSLPYYIRFDLTGVMCLHSMLPRYHVVQGFVLFYFIVHIWPVCTVVYITMNGRLAWKRACLTGIGEHMSCITQHYSAFLYVPCVLISVYQWGGKKDKIEIKHKDKQECLASTQYYLEDLY